VALVAALSLLAMLGLLIAAAVASTATTQRAAHLAYSDSRLTLAADNALGVVLSEAATYGMADLPFGRARTVSVGVSDANGAPTTVTMTRLRGDVLWLVAEASVDAAHVRRRVNVVARFPSVGPLPRAAIVARGAVALAADVAFSADSIGDPDCPADGTPPTVQTSDSSALFQTAWQLARLDSAPGVLHVRGDTAIAGGAFSGILVVDGSLTVTAPFSVIGLVIVRGPFRSPAGLNVVGAIVSQAGGPGPGVEISGAVIRYSPCTIGRVLRTAQLPRIVRGRGWSEVF
jgi:hypothetical protein